MTSPKSSEVFSTFLVKLFNQHPLLKRVPRARTCDMKKIVITFALCLTAAISSPRLEAQNITVDVHGALALVNYFGVDAEGGFGSAFGIHPAYFFHKSLGVFSGFDIVNRPVNFTATGSANWLEVPVGLMFRGKEGDQNMVGLGLSLALPIGDYNDGSTTYDTNGGLALMFVTNRYYNLNASFALGIYSDIRYSFYAPLADAAFNDGKTLTFNIGLGARATL